MGSSVGKSYPLTFKLVTNIISDHGLPMDSSDCYITLWAASSLGSYIIDTEKVVGSGHGEKRDIPNDQFLDRPN